MYSLRDAQNLVKQHLSMRRLRCAIFCRHGSWPTPPRCGAPALRQVRKGRADAQSSERKENKRLLRRHAANPGRAGPWPQATSCRGGGRTTAAVRRAARPGQPATALTFRPQAAERHCHHRHEAEPQAPACRERSVSPCGKRCRPGYRSAPGRNGGCSPASKRGCPKGSA